jgi:hypothetical protein
MRSMKVFWLAAVVGIGGMMQPGAVAAQTQIIGPLYALGPMPTEPEPQWRDRRYGGDAPRARRRYGSSFNYDRPYSGYRYWYRNRQAAPYWYGRPRYGRYLDRPRYTARVLTPRWYGGPQQALGAVYPQRRY